MAVKSKNADKFANIAHLQVTESAAGTLTYAQLSMANTLMSERFAMIIHRAEVTISNIHSQFNAAGDTANFGLCLSDRVTNITDLSQPEVLFMGQLVRVDFGAAASGYFFERPVVYDFTLLPGGGLLVPADRLYIGAQGVSLVAALTVAMRLYYTVMPLDTADYWELIEARRVMTT